MRVLYWTELFWPYIGGVEVLGSQFVRGMRLRGHEFVVVTSHGSLDLPDRDVLDDVPIRRFPFLQVLTERDLGGIGRATRAVAQVKREFAPDLVHVNLSDPGVLFHLHTMSAHPAPLLVSVRVALPTGQAGPDTLVGRTLRSADWVVGNSEAILRATRRLVPEIAARSSVIYNGLAEPPTTPAAPPPEPVVLCLGRVVSGKGFDLAIAAFPDVLARFPDARLVIAGDGPARPALEQQARDLGVSGEVDFCGWVAPQGVPDLMNAATVVVVPSRIEEAFGLVALEAAFVGRPVVAARVGGLPEVVADGETGVLVAPDDVRALADAVLALLADPQRAARLGECARCRAMRLFSLRRHLDEYDSLYRKLRRDGADVEFA